MIPTELDSTLTPVLRDAIDVVKMVLFKRLKSLLSGAYPQEDGHTIVRLSGAVLNALFGTVNTQEPHVGFARENRARIDATLFALVTRLPDLQGVLTDAVRMQFLCDVEDGIDSEHVLTRAAEIGLLAVDREIPLPKGFMALAREVGVANDVLAPSPEGAPKG